MSVLAHPPGLVSLLAASIPDLQPVEELLPPTFWELHCGTILSGGLILLAVSALAWWWCRRGRTIIISPSADDARATLGRLAGSPDNGFLAGLVLQTLRHYLPSVLSALPRGEWTVDEIIPPLQKEPSLPPELKEEITVLLRQCEQRQFFTGPVAAPVRFVDRALVVIVKIETARGAPAIGSTRQP
jgi:hypothetical protein